MHSKIFASLKFKNLGSIISSRTYLPRSGALKMKCSRWHWKIRCCNTGRKLFVPIVNNKVKEEEVIGNRGDKRKNPRWWSAWRDFSRGRWLSSNRIQRSRGWVLEGWFIVCDSRAGNGPLNGNCRQLLDKSEVFRREFSRAFAATFQFRL